MKMGREVWTVAAQMAPYLLFGFLMAGLLSVLVSPAFVERHLGRRGFRQVLKASLLGVPLPLCSCGVLPVAASLRKHGAGKGATLSFLVSTPQTGLDSIMVTHALLGPVFVVFRVLTALVSGVLGGWLLEAVDKDDKAESNAECECASCDHGKTGGRTRRALRFGFVQLPGEIGRAMLLGIVISGVLTAIIPENYFADRLGPGIVSMLAMLVIGIPIYACSAGSVPIAFALMRMGISPGAALVFLVTGPATNAASLTTVWSTLGRRAVIIYLGSIAVCALAAGLLLDQFVLTQITDEVLHAHRGIGWLHHVSAVALLVVLVPAFRPKHKTTASEE